MSKRKKILIFSAVLLVFIVILSATCFHASFHWTKDNNQRSATTSSGIGWAHVDTIKTCSKLAIVTPPVAEPMRDLQKAIAEDLRDHLLKAKIVFKVDRKSHRYTTSCPSVKMYTSKAKALKHKSDFILFVKPTVWQHLPVSFFYQDYLAEVTINGDGPYNNGDKTIIMDNSILSFDIDSNIKLQGKMKGIFSTSYMTESAASNVAEGLVDEMTDKLTEWAKDAMKPEDD